MIHREENNQTRSEQVLFRRVFINDAVLTYSDRSVPGLLLLCVGWTLAGNVQSIYHSSFNAFKTDLKTVHSRDESNYLQGDVKSLLNCVLLSFPRLASMFLIHSFAIWRILSFTQSFFHVFFFGSQNSLLHLKVYEVENCLSFTTQLNKRTRMGIHL